MIFFPDWADLGISHIDNATQNTWQTELSRASKAFYYWSGFIFKEKVTDEDLELEDAPLLYPIGVNLVKMLALAHADATFGEFDELPVTFAERKDQNNTPGAKEGIELISNVMLHSSASQMLWEGELERQVFGGTAYKVSPDLSMPGGGVRWSRVQKGSFFPIWDPEDPDRLLEVYTIDQINGRQASLKYGYETTRDWVNRVERWGLNSHETILDQEVQSGHSGSNPWGVIPFVYLPRYRLGNWFGDSLTDDLTDVQNELNMRLGDIGEAINYNAHPIKYGTNLPNDFTADNYPLGPNAMWDLGRALGNSPPPTVGVLEPKNPIPVGSFPYVEFLYDWARTSTFAPPIAFGEDNGGGQRSGATLEIRLWPMLKAIARSRAYHASGMRRMANITGLIYKQKNYRDVPAKAIDCLIEGGIGPRYARVLPRDQAAIVDEVVKLLSTSPPSVSLETAQVMLGRGSSEVARIIEMVQNDELNKAMQDAMVTEDDNKKKKGGKDSDKKEDKKEDKDD
jgi:hypothetical protein